MQGAVVSVAQFFPQFTWHLNTAEDDHQNTQNPTYCVQSHATSKGQISFHLQDTSLKFTRCFPELLLFFAGSDYYSQTPLTDEEHNR